MEIIIDGNGRFVGVIDYFHTAISRENGPDVEIQVAVLKDLRTLTTDDVRYRVKI